VVIEEHRIGEEGREDDCCTGRDGGATTHRLSGNQEERWREEGESEHSLLDYTYSVREAVYSLSARYNHAFFSKVKARKEDGVIEFRCSFLLQFAV